MFKRKPRSYLEAATQTVYPKGGWRRAFRYMGHRIRRLPDQPDRIGRGIAAGVFASFSPFFGLHFILAGLCGWLIGGNVLAALLATAFGNPLTFPFIAMVSVTFGRWMLGMPGTLSPAGIMAEIGSATVQVWHNLLSVFNDDVAQWDRLGSFWTEIFFPYTIGGLLPGLLAGLVCHYVSVPIIRAYHAGRRRKIARKIALAEKADTPIKASSPDVMPPLGGPASQSPQPQVPPEAR